MKTVAHRRYGKSFGMFVLIVLMLALPALAMASGTGGSGSNPFDGATTTIIEWLKGGLGLLLSILALGIGLIAGLRVGSIWGIAIGFGFAVVCYYGPDILQSIFGASL
jgi:conjugal transfer pilus assembly protein TraA